MCVYSKAIHLPELEQPIEARTATHRQRFLKITGLGEGGNNLARLSATQYAAIIIVCVLAAILVLPFQ